MKNIAFVIGVFYSALFFCQSQNIDSLRNEIKKPLDDSNKVNSLCLLSWDLRRESPDESMSYIDKAISISEKIFFLKGLTTGYNTKGVIYKNKSEYAKALKCYEKAFTYAKKQNDISQEGNLYLNMGYAYYYMGLYKQCEENYFKALKTYETCGHKGGQGNTLINLSESYVIQKEYEKAIETLKKALFIKRQTTDSSGVGVIYANLVDIYLEKKDIPQAEKNFLYLEKLASTFTSKFWGNFIYSIKARLLFEKGNYNDCILYCKKSEAFCMEIKDKNSLASICVLMGSAYYKMGDFINSRINEDKAKAIAKEIGAREIIKSSSLELSKIYEGSNDYKLALEEYKNYSSYKDSLADTENKKQQLNIEALYNTEKNEKEITLLSKNNEIKEQEISKQKAIRYTISLILFFAIGLIFFVFKGYRDKKKANDIILKQKAEVETQKQEILDSINYARRIQESILPNKEYIKEYLPDFFILYQPKDVVSGDFYYFKSINNKHIIAAADCTGHGVPGAFMSLLCKENLDKTLKENYTSTGTILSELNKNIKGSLNQNNLSDSRDGMDVALCIIEDKTIKYSGANRPLIIKREGIAELEEIKPTKSSIAGFTDNNQQYQETVFNLNKGDILYLFSDGYSDQFGGEKNKKLSTKKFKNYLLSISNEPMNKQETLLRNFYDSWKKGYEQIDDVLVIGIKI